ncbi:MAG TPA: ABC transporter permease [Rudaea sp.]|nr:ABC transporter permease [Rudaea sp.]
MLSLIQDLRHGLRSLAAKPAFTLVAVLTLALGIGANTLVFTLIDAVYLRALPYRDADALVDLYASSAQFGGGVDNVSIPDYVDLHAGMPALADSALYTDASFNLVDSGTPERLQGLRATPSLFPTLGVSAALGRVFADDEAVAGRDRVVVLGDALWRNRFNADPQVLGRSLRFDGVDYRVIGVMPPRFMFPRADVGLYVPFAFSSGDLSEDQRGVNYSSIVARLAPGATLAQVASQAAALLRHNVERLGSSGGDGASYANWVDSTGFRFGVRPLRDQLTGRNARELVVLQVAVALVLLIALANVANLLLTRLSARRAELATRTALGARRIDIARQLLTESALLALAGALAGLAGAWFGIRLVAGSGLLPAWATFAVDFRTLAFTVVVTGAATLIFGLVPARIAAGGQPQTTLCERRLAGGTRAARRARSTLVVVQIALAIALLAGAGLLLRSFVNAAEQSPGFASSNVLTAHLALPAAKYPDAAAQARAVRGMLDAVRALPGVEAAGATTKLPFSGENAGIVFRIEGRSDDASLPHAAWRSVDENFFATLGIPLLRGRVFSAADWNAQDRNIVVDASFAQRYFPDRDAIGQRITLGDSGTGDAYTIIGVVGAVKHFDLTQPAQKPTFYFDLGAHGGDSVFLALHTSAAPAAIAEALRTAIRSVDSEQPLFNIATLDQRIESSLTGRRVPLQLLALFAACALLLAAIGIYGVLSFGVEQRTGEIGLRMAIGADSARVRRGVLADGARLVGAGVGAGVLGALATGYLLKSRLFDVAPVDPPSLAAVAAVIVVTAFAACWLPARRAARLDPIVALRHE